jgi:hypothetical protein
MEKGVVCMYVCMYVCMFIYIYIYSFQEPGVSVTNKMCIRMGYWIY